MYIHMNYLVLFSGAMSTFFYLVVRCETHDLYVYVCIYIYIYVYIFIYMYIYICIYTYTYTHYIYIHIYIFKLLEFSSCAMSSCFHLVVQWETYNFYACINLYIYIYIYIYTYIHIYIMGIFSVAPCLLSFFWLCDGRHISSMQLPGKMALPPRWKALWWPPSIPQAGSLCVYVCVCAMCAQWFDMSNHQITICAQWFDMSNHCATDFSRICMGWLWLVGSLKL